MNNYHTHTYRCFHASGRDEDYVKAAIKAGFDEIGFSDHTPWHYDSAFHSHMRMEENQLKGYVQSIRELREKYKDQISIKIGLECEYFERYLPWLKQIINQYELDYLICGNHYDGTDEYGIYYGYPVNREQFVRYVDQCVKAIQSGLFAYVAHADLVNYDTTDSFYKEQMKRICLEAKKHHMPIEFNLLGYSTHRNYPNDTFFHIVKEVGNQVILGVDAHDPSSLTDLKTRNEAEEYLHSLGIELTNQIKFLK